MTQKINKKTPADRLNYSGDLQPVVEKLSLGYGVGTLKNYSVIGVGYEDCNIIVETENGKFVAKIFQKDRDPEDIARYIGVMQKVIEAGVNHPLLLKTQAGNIAYDDQENGLSLVLMKFIEGNTFFDLERAPTDEERHGAIEQAAVINQIDYHPPYIFDSWAVPNIQAIYNRVKQFAKPVDLKLVEQAMVQYEEIPLDDLPRCFVHGDLTNTNVIKGTDGKIYILDFSVANWYPRIQEIAVISVNLLHDADLSLRDRTEKVVTEYSSFIPLSPEEIRHLYAYSLAGFAMEFMGSLQEKYINNNVTKETEYWLRLGREGLSKALA